MSDDDRLESVSGGSDPSPPGIPPRPASAPKPAAPGVAYAALQKGLQALSDLYTAQEASLNPDRARPVPVAMLLQPLLCHDKSHLNPFTAHHAAPLVREWACSREPIPTTQFKDKLKRLSASLELPGREDPLYIKGVDLLWLAGALCERALDPDNPFKIDIAQRNGLSELLSQLLALDKPSLNRTWTQGAPERAPMAQPRPPGSLPNASKPKPWLMPESRHSVEILQAVLADHGLQPQGVMHPQIAQLVSAMKILEARGVFPELGAFARHPLPESEIKAWHPRQRYGTHAMNGFPLDHAWPGGPTPAVHYLADLRNRVLPELTGQPDWKHVKALVIPHLKHHFMEDQAPEETMYGDARLAARSSFAPSLHHRLTEPRQYQALNCFGQVAETLACNLDARRPGHPRSLAEARMERFALMKARDVAQHILRLGPNFAPVPLTNKEDMQRSGRPESDAELHRLAEGETSLLDRFKRTTGLGPRAQAELHAWAETQRATRLAR